MKVIIETIDHLDHRYNTIGDWYYVGEDLHIRVSKLSTWRREMLVAVHELVEALWCKNMGITAQMVDEFDLAHPTGPGYEPGDDPLAPYYGGHQAASMMEHLMGCFLGVEKPEYEFEIDTLMRGTVRLNGDRK